MSQLPPLPHFVIIGAQKSATRWLRSNLGLHPEIFAAERELHFWNRPSRVHAPAGFDWYREQFAGWRGEALVGEATPGYLIWRHRPWRTARLMSQHHPSVQLIALLRNPIDRAQSAARHHARRNRIPPGARLVDVLRERQPAALDRLCLVSGGWYWASLSPYFKYFGDRTLVLLHDDVVTSPTGVYERTLMHIGASGGFVPERLDRVVFGSGRNSGAGDELTREERIEVWGYFRDDVARLEDLLGRDLSLWDPTR